MLKAVKECMKNWLMVHKRLYWYIVIGLAVLAFGVVTAVGCAKVYEANAGEAVTDAFAQHDFIADYNTACDYILEHHALGAEYLDNRPCRYVVCGWNSANVYSSVYFTSNPIDFGDLSQWHTVEASDVLCIYVRLDTGKADSFYLGDYGTGTADLYCDALSLRYTTHDIAYGDGLVIEATKPVIYSVDAPYVTFERLDVVNKIADGNTKVLFVNPYEDYTKTSSWEYFGTLRNMDSSKDLEYLLEVEFLAELPKDAYLEELADELGVDVTWEYNMLRNTPDLVMMWNADNRAEKDVYEFTYTFPVVPDEHGYFSYELAFDTIEALIQYFNTDARERIQSYEEGHRAFLLSFLHIDCVSAVVKTTREDSIVYGKITTNQFERGIYDVCIEVIPDVDINTATPEEIDKIIADATQDAHDKYLKDLEKRLENLQNQINGVGSVEGAFANGLDGTDLWSGFQSLSSGLVSLAPSISSLSVLMGAVFGFLPVQIVGAMSFTLFALCVIALIKAIRG